MARFLVVRLFVLIATLFAVSAVAFLVPFLSGVDPARAIIRARSTALDVDPDAAEALRLELGLDRPLAVQYVEWLGQVLTGDLGLSFTSRLPVADLIGSALLVSATLAATALALALLVALPLGVLAALRQGRFADTAVTCLAQVFVAIPEYWLAPLCVLLFSVHLGWLPSAGWSGPASLVLPALVLALRPLAYFAQVMRASMIEVLQAEYMIGARSRGLSLAGALLRHGLRNGLLPVLTVFAMWLAALLGGSVVVEVIFAIPGMGRLVYDAVVNADIPLLQASLIAIVGLAVTVNTIADILYGVLDPRTLSRAGAPPQGRRA